MLDLPWLKRHRNETTEDQCMESSHSRNINLTNLVGYNRFKGLVPEIFLDLYGKENKYFL